VKLYTEVRNVLNEGSLFINADCMKTESPAFFDWTVDNWIRWIVQKTKEYTGKQLSFEQEKQKQLEYGERFGDKPGTLWEMYSDMKQAGFSYVDSMMQYQISTVMVATR